MKSHFNQLTECLSKAITDHEVTLKNTASLCSKSINNGGTIFVAGNGGSFSQAQHFAAELVVRLLPTSSRRGLPASALMSDGASLTACANDLDYSNIYSRALEALASESDILILLSTSGKSPNILKAAQYAKSRNIPVISFLGGSSSAIKEFCEFCFCIESNNTAIIQESHLFLLHELATLIDSEFAEVSS